MKKLTYFLMAALMVLADVSCDKDNSNNKYGGDGRTPMPDAVDIGLVVNGQKILFASCNLGASKEDELGDYYAWGETEIHYKQLDPITWKDGMEAGYSWSLYKYANGQSNRLTRYCANYNGVWAGEGSVADGLTELLPEDDVVRVRLGGNWRMPTEEEMQALVDLHNKDGYDFTYEENGLRITETISGNSVFFPYSGAWYDDMLLSGSSVWTSTVMESSPNNAQLFYFKHGDDEALGIGSRARAHGLQVRPVYVEGEGFSMTAVDIGMTVNGKKILWGNRNLGAKKEYESGYYYAWGEIEPKETYYWSNYRYANGAYNKLTKYCPKDREGDYWDMNAIPSGADGKMQLDPGDDVASVKLGGKWRMPTGEEIQALVALKDNGNYEWDPWFAMSNASGETVHGLKVTQKSTGNYIFLPAAGQYYEGTFYPGGENESGYWSSTLYDGGCALFLYMDSYEEEYVDSMIGRDDHERICGCSVRPVCEE